MSAHTSPLATDTVYHDKPQPPEFLRQVRFAILALAVLLLVVGIATQDNWASFTFLVMAAAAYGTEMVWSARKEKQWNATWRWYESDVKDVELNLEELQEQLSASQDELVASVVLANGHCLPLLTIPAKVVHRAPLTVVYQGRQDYDEWEFQNIQFKDAP